MSSQSNTETRTGNDTRKEHQSGSVSTNAVVQIDKVLSTRSIRLVPSSPYVELSSVPSVSSECGIASPYTNQSTYLTSPYPNPASNAHYEGEYSTTAFNIHEDNVVSNETTYKNNSGPLSVPSPAPNISNAKKRNSGPGTGCTFNGSGESSPVNENSGPSHSKKVKTSSPPELNEMLIIDGIIDLMEEIEEESEKTELSIDNTSEEQSENTEISTVNINKEQSRKDYILNEEDISNADCNVLDALLLKYSLEEMGRLMLDASRRIGPDTDNFNVQRMLKLSNRMISAWGAEWKRLPQQLPAPNPEYPLFNGGSTFGNGSYCPESSLNNDNNGGENGVPCPILSRMLIIGSQNDQNDSANVLLSPQDAQVPPQPLLRSIKYLEPIVTPPFSTPPVVADSVGSSSQNGLPADLPHLQNRSNFTLSANLIPGVNFRPQDGPEAVAQLSPSNSAAASDQITFHAASNSVTMPQPPGNSQVPSPPPPLIPVQRNRSMIFVQGNRLMIPVQGNRAMIPVQGSQAGALPTILIKVGNNEYSFSHNDWAAISGCTTVPKMTKTLFDKLFTHEERLNCTVSGRKRKSGLPLSALDPCKMLALYACVSFLQRNQSQLFPTDPIDSSEYKLEDKEKTKIKIIISQKLNAAKQQHARRNDASTTT